MAGVEGVAELLIYGDIGDMRFLGMEMCDVSSKGIAQELKALGDVSEISVRINSPGGSVFSAQAIYSLLKTHSAKVKVYVDGMAASAASLIAMAGDEIVMPSNAMMMIHSPMTYVGGNPVELRKQAEILEKVQESMLAAYARSGQSLEAIKSMLEAETWMTANEAVELGFADQLDTPLDIAASIGSLNLDPSRFKRPPEIVASITASDKKTPNDAPEPLPDGSEQAQDKNDEEDFPMTPDELKAKRPDLFEAVSKIGEERERARIQAIEGLGPLGALAAEAKYDKPCSPEELAVRVIQASSEKGQAFLAGLRSDAAGMPDVNSSAQPSGENNEEEEKKTVMASILEGIRHRRGILG